MKEAVILANGNFPTHPYPLQVLKKAAFLVCCDGAANNLLNTGQEPDVIIGDLDSISQDILEENSSRILHKPDQESNDLTKAVRFCRSKGYNKLRIVGATGKREDHTIGNMGLLARYAQQGHVEMITDHEILTVIYGKGDVKTQPGQQVSFFNTTAGVPVTASNVKYPVTNLLLDQWWQGTLNEATGTSISLHAPGATLIVFLLYADTNSPFSR